MMIRVTSLMSVKRETGAVLAGERQLRERGTPDPIIPLSERILARLGPPRAWWVVVWGCVAFGTYELSHRLYHAPTYPGVGFAAASAYFNILALWGVGKLARGLNASQPLIAEMRTASHEEFGVQPFRLVGSTAGPLLLLLAGSSLLFVVNFLRYPSAVTAVIFPFLYIGWLPGVCMVWVCFTLFWGLDRLGRYPLRLTSFHQDRSLGLAPLGRLANAAFLLILAAILPFGLFAGRDLPSVAVIFGYFVVGVVLFVASGYRLHQQMVGAKRQYLAHVRRLHAEAFAPVETDWSLDTLSAQAARINAADALERRVAAIHEWPISEAVLARTVAIATAIFSGLVARLVLRWI